MFCREQVVQLRDGVGEIRKAGAELVVVGNGRPQHALDFRSEYELDFPLVVDPELQAYRAAGLRRGLQGVAGLSDIIYTIFRQNLYRVLRLSKSGPRGRPPLRD